MIVKLLTEHHMEFLSLKGGCTGTYESTTMKTPHCWKSHVAAQITLPNTASDQYLAASGTPFEWRLAGGPIVACLYICLLGVSYMYILLAKMTSL